ncbi:MAG: hypothetical protein ACJ77E_19620, partial [Gaiellaceae bacterium]
MLGAVIVSAGVGLVDAAAWRALAAIDRVEVAIAGVTTGCVVVLVMCPVTLPAFWVASTKRCKDAGSVHSSSTDATEDAAARRVIGGQGAANVAGQVTSVLQALVVAVGLSTVDTARRSARPYDAVLGRVDALGRYADVSLHPSARITPAVVVYRLDDRLFFA